MNIATLFDSVPYGTSKRFDCPLCKGKGTLSITIEQGKVKYHCFKARCTLRGSRYALMTNAEGKQMIASRNALEARTDVKAPFAIPDYWVMGLASKKCFQMLLNNNAIEAYTLGLFKVGYDPRQNRLLYFIQNTQGLIVGAVGRSLEREYPKVYNYPSSTKLPFTCGTGDTAVLVEDCASACSIGRLRDYTGVALLGTELKNDYLFYLIANFSKVIIALDRDATYKSTKLRKVMAYYIKDIKVWKLTTDLKNLDCSGLLKYINNTNNNI